MAVIAMLALAPVTFAQDATETQRRRRRTGSISRLPSRWVSRRRRCGLGQGRATAAACESMARNPGAAGPIRNAFIIGVALIESLVLYVLVVVLIK